MEVPRHQPRVLVDADHLAAGPVGDRLFAQCRRWQAEYVGGVYLSVRGGRPAVRQLLAAGLSAHSATFYEPSAARGLTSLGEVIARLVPSVAPAAYEVAEIIAIGPTGLVGWPAAERSCRLVVSRLNAMLGAAEVATPRQIEVPVEPDPAAADDRCRSDSTASVDHLLRTGHRRISRACEQLIDLLEDLE